MVLSITERIKGFSFSPSKTFDASKEDTLGDAFKYFILILAIYAVLSAIVFSAAVSLIQKTPGFFSAFMPMPMPIPLFGAGMGVLTAVSIFIGAIIGGIIVIFIGGLWLHIWVYLVGGKKGIEQTLKALMYGATPSYLFGWIPIVNVLAGIWALIVEIIGIRQLHELSMGKAVLAVVIGTIIIVVILGAIVIFAAFFMATMPEPVLPGTTGPGF